MVSGTVKVEEQVTKAIRFCMNTRKGVLKK